jgi:CelD/BcsL family acetyltransferase involved in cellulose biosynthesis
LSLLCLPGYEAEVARRFATWLTGPAARDWDQLEFTGVAHDDPAMQLLIEHLSADGQLSDQRFDFQCWRTQLPPDWDSFLAGLSSSRRQRTRMLLRRSVDQGRIVLREVATAEDLAHAFPILVDLHQKRRQSLGQEGCFACPQFSDFHRDVSRRFLAAGKLRMLWLERAGQPIAVEYGFVGGDTVYYYQGGFDPAAADERPGWLCIGASLRRAIDEGYCAYDFLRGDESYKASWHAESRPMLQYRVFGRGSSGQLRRAAWWSTQSAKRFVRGCKAALAPKPSDQPAQNPLQNL